MPSEPFTVTGACGRTLEGKAWKSGASLKCIPGGVSMNTYPRPTTFGRMPNDLCTGCPENPSKKGYYEQKKACWDDSQGYTQGPDPKPQEYRYPPEEEEP